MLPILLALAGLAATAWGKQMNKLVIVGDSTAAEWADNDKPIQGWGVYAQQYFSIEVVNKAIPGYSSRVWLRDTQHWGEVLDAVDKRTVVLIELGHNDMFPAGDPDDRRHRGTLPGIDESEHKEFDGEPDAAYTMGHYLDRMAGELQAKGATVVISGMTPKIEAGKNGGEQEKEWAYSGYARALAEREGLEFIDHTGFAAEALRKEGGKRAKGLISDYYQAFFPDTTHTNPKGAELMAETLAAAVKYKGGRRSVLEEYLSKAGEDVESPFAPEWKWTAGLRRRAVWF